ncbi:MAG: hypothetical protein C0507_10410, partial [Cyanobacteria bacterium PR.3.49]|nr:hypothetical protein [Cyanobacteria bacterium PR.3.49]
MGSYQERTPQGGEVTYSMNPLAAPTIEPGTILLGKFRVVGLLGVGGMGSVYRVDHLLMERQFALKCLNKFQEANASWRRFQNEAKAAHMVDHPNLLKVFEFGLLESGQPFFLMELVEGQTLSDEIKSLGHLPIERAVSIFIQVAFAIDYAHKRGIVHRDLKPSNIMLVPPKSEHESESVRVVDFGIAKLTGVDEFNQQTLTKTGEVFGSPFYMSPEQCMGLPVDHRCDLYSLGCVFYETLTSAPPFMGESALSTMMKHQSEIQLPLKEASMGMSYPALLEEIISKLLEKDPANRYQSAGQLANELITLEQAIKEHKQQISGQGPTLASSLQPGSGQSKIDHFVKTLTLAKLIGVGLSMYLLGAASLYAGLTILNKQGVKTAVVEQPIQEPQASQEGLQYWSQVEGNKKIFYFPDKLIGMLVGDNGSKAIAVGRVSVPLGVKTGLCCGTQFFDKPEYLERFRPDEMYLIDFNTNTAGPDNLAALKRFVELRVLNVSGTAFSDKDLSIIPSFKNLKFLNLSHTDVDCSNLLKYPNALKLNCLDLSHTMGTDVIIKAIDKFPQLQALWLDVCGLTDVEMKGLAKSKTIKSLSLNTNTITDRGISYLLPMRSLERLDINRTPVTPKIASILKKFPNLKVVEMGLRMQWSEKERENFIREINSGESKVKVFYGDLHTSHEEANMQNFPWKGPG